MTYSFKHPAYLAFFSFVYDHLQPTVALGLTQRFTLAGAVTVLSILIPFSELSIFFFLNIAFDLNQIGLGYLF